MDEPERSIRGTWALRSVRRVFPGRERALAIAAFVALWLPLLLAALRALLDGTPLARHVDPVLGFVVDHLAAVCVGGLVLGVATLFFAGGSESGRADARVDRHALYVVRGERERRVPRGLILEGIARRGVHPEIELHLSRGETLRLSLESDAMATALLEALDLGPSRRRAAIALGEPGSMAWRRAFGVGCTLILGLALGGLALFALDAAGAESILVAVARTWLLVVLAATLLVLRRLRFIEVTIGSDGLVVKRPFSTRFIDFRRVESVHPAGTKVVIRYRGGRVEEIKGASEDAALAVVQRARKAMEPSSDVEPVSRTGWLERRGRSLANWRAAVIAGLRPASEYRSAAHAPEDARRVLEDPKAPAEQRIGAALALGGSGDPRAASKVRAVAETCANKRLRIAIASAADAEADLAAIEEALAAEAERPQARA